VTQTNTKFVLAYLLLVVMPVAGLAGVLRSGRNLTAPNAVGGLWKMQIRPGSLATLPCGKSLLAARDADFTISQSGKNFTLNFFDTAILPASGAIEGTTIQVSLFPAAAATKEAGCDAGHVLSLTATLDLKANDSMAGVLTVNECPACAPVEFRALREEPAKGTGDH
jgi:hypothetical protein